MKCSIKDKNFYREIPCGDLEFLDFSQILFKIGVVVLRFQLFNVVDKTLSFGLD